LIRYNALNLTAVRIQQRYVPAVLDSNNLELFNLLRNF
jgi:hypothetical protein